MTVSELIEAGAKQLADAGVSVGHGTTNAYDEAAYLLLHQLHLPLDRLEPFLDAPDQFAFMPAAGRRDDGSPQGSD